MERSVTDWVASFAGFEVGERGSARLHRRGRRRQGLRHGLLPVEPPYAELPTGSALVEQRGQVAAVRGERDGQRDAGRQRGRGGDGAARRIPEADAVRHGGLLLESDVI